MKKTTLLCVLDGFGLNPNPKANAVAIARKPVFDRLWASCPRSTLTTFGERVGLPEGQMGNSEVGHLNIGAGRVVEQWLLRIDRALRGNYLDSSAQYQSWLGKTKQSGAIHLIGLYSDGGVHSHSSHLLLTIQRLRRDSALPIKIHLITDGRDTAVDRSLTQVPELLAFCAKLPDVTIASISGRYFAMDRDKRWERTQAGYDAIVGASPRTEQGLVEYLTQQHESGTTDEFIRPASFAAAGIDAKDSLLFWNFREDRMRQLSRAICAADFREFNRSIENPSGLNVLCFTEYDHSLPLPSLFPLLEIKNHLGEVIGQAGLRQVRAAETEKYPHVTYFFNGGVEKPCAGEERQLSPSPRDVKTYDLRPEMSAEAVASGAAKAIRSGDFDFVVVNFANCDMVGHTGVLDAAVRAVETVDRCLGMLIEALDEVGGQAVIIADHGNAEQMVNYEDGSPHTTHTKYPVPIIIYGSGDIKGVKDGGALCDVAPTILKLMGLGIPAEMTGTPLF